MKDWGAEEVGFEPTVPENGTPVFETVARPATDASNTQTPNELRDVSLPDGPSEGHDLAHDACQTDPDLALVHAASDRLPEAVRAGMVAMVKAAARE